MARLGGRSSLIRTVWPRAGRTTVRVRCRGRGRWRPVAPERGARSGTAALEVAREQSAGAGAPYDHVGSAAPCGGPWSAGWACPGRRRGERGSPLRAAASLSIRHRVRSRSGCRRSVRNRSIWSQSVALARASAGRLVITARRRRGGVGLPLAAASRRPWHSGGGRCGVHSGQPFGSGPGSASRVMCQGDHESSRPRTTRERP
jgi:hypothetical protein